VGQLTFEGSQIFDGLVASGYVLQPHGISDTAVDELIAAYANFTDNLPDPDLETVAAMIKDPEKLDDLAYEKDTQHEWHKYRTNHPFIFKPGGYTNRSLQAQALRAVHGIEIAEDPKEYYHFLPATTALIHRQAETFGWGPVPPEVEALNKRFMDIHRLGAITIKDTLLKLEEHYPESLTKFMTKRDFEQSPVRLVFYHPDQGDILAGGHYDKAWLTAQLAESHEGLRIRNPQTGDMQPIIRTADKAAVFASSLLTLDHAYPDSEILAGWHDVINVDTPNQGRTMHGKKVARWALIFFANSQAAGEIGKEITHVGPASEELVA
jgi:hypothetical protein